MVLALKMNLTISPSVLCIRVVRFSLSHGGVFQLSYKIG